MTKFRLAGSVYVIGLGIWGITAIASQKVASSLPEGVRAHVKADSFQVVSTLRGLPLGVRDEMSKNFGGRYLDIAEPGDPFRATDVVSDPNLPTRRLISAACSMDHCIVYYERGGIAHTRHVAVLHWTPEETRLEWGGSAPAGLTTLESLRNAILSGAIKAGDSW